MHLEAAVAVAGLLEDREGYCGHVACSMAPRGALRTRSGTRDDTTRGRAIRQDPSGPRMDTLEAILELRCGIAQGLECRRIRCPEAAVVRFQQALREAARRGGVHAREPFPHCCI